MAEEVPPRGNMLGKYVPARYILAVLGSIGMAIIYGLKVNLSVAMVAMLNHTAINLTLQETTLNNSFEESSTLLQNMSQTLTDFTKPFLNLTEEAKDGVASAILNFTEQDLNINEECSNPDGSANITIEDGKFNWSAPLQGILLSCYFWGYLVSQIPGAYIAENFSAKWVMFSSVALNVISTLLTPILTELHFSGLIVARILEGIGGGSTFPSMHCLIAAWAPPSERSIFSTIVYVGTSFGTAISILLAGVLSHTLGWESVFYVMGGLSCIWLVLWAFLIADSPDQQRFISAEERKMIVEQLSSESGPHAKDEKHPAVPWRAVLTSLPFWAILIAHCASNWGWYMFLIEIPFYMKQVLKFDVASNAIRSALPFFPLLIFSTILGKSLDILRNKEKISTTFARKFATACGSLIPGACLFILCYIECRHTAAVAIMSVGIIAMGGMFPGFLSNHIDIAPHFAGTLVALTNTVATLSGIIVPLFVGYVTKGNQTIEAWRTIFFVTIVLFGVEFIVFTLFGSGEVQPWNNTEKKDEEHAEQNEFTPLKTEENEEKNSGSTPT